MKPGEENEVCKMIAGVFDEFVGSGYSPEGVAEFMKYCDPAAMAARREGHFTLIAECQGLIAGAIEVRNNEHISLFFVLKEFHSRGIGGKLFQAALEKIAAETGGKQKMTVNSSPFAVKIYEKLGFVQTEPETTINGIVFVPMERT